MLPSVQPSLAQTRPLSRFRASIQGQPIDVRAADFPENEVEVLRKWAAVYSPRRRSQEAQPPAPQPVEQLALRLVSAHVDLDTKRGRATYSALREMGLLQPFAGDVIDLLVRDFGTHHLERTRFVYNGHATEAMFPLFPTLHALGIKGASMVSAPQSGSGAMHQILEMQLSKGEEVIREEASRDHKTDKARFESAALAKMKALAEQASKAGEILIVDKGGLLAHHLDDRTRELIRNGTIRFIVHNRDDVDALAGLVDEAYMVDVASSLLKAIEARIIGEQYALLGNREALGKWGANDGAARYVMGYGLIGRSIAEGLVRVGYAAGSITVIDSDPEKRAEAARAGFGVLSAEERPVAKPERAVVYVATPGCGIDGRNACAYGKQTLILAATSAGKGVDIPSIRAISNDELCTKVRLGASGAHLNVPGKFNDRRFRIPDGRTAWGEEVTVILDGYPLNLFEESWPDRYGITAAVVAIACAEAAALEGPGLHRMDPDRQRGVIDAFTARGLMNLRPLDPPVLTTTPFRVMLPSR